MRRVAFNVAVVCAERAAETLHRFGPDWCEAAAMPTAEAARPNQPPAVVRGFLKLVLEAAYPPSLSQDVNKRIAADRPCALVVLRKNGAGPSHP